LFLRGQVKKLKMYDKGVQMTSGEVVYQTLLSYRSGDMWAPKVEAFKM